MHAYLTSTDTFAAISPQLPHPVVLSRLDSVTALTALSTLGTVSQANLSGLTRLIVDVTFADARRLSAALALSKSTDLARRMSKLPHSASPSNLSARSGLLEVRESLSPPSHSCDAVAARR